MTPPDLLPFDAFGGDWQAYENELYRISWMRLREPVFDFAAKR